MATQEFDFLLTPEGELAIEEEARDIIISKDDELRIQLAYNRIKSVSNNWYIDNIGADLEELIGMPCSTKSAEYGKEKIMQQLTYDGLWDSQHIHIQASISSNTNITYAIFLRIFNENAIEESYAYEIIAEIDLVKGVCIKFGWEPRNTGWFQGIQYT